MAINIEDYMELNEENIEKQHKAVIESPTYGKEIKLIHEVLEKFPKNNDVNIIAMKISLIDLTNSTQLSLHKRELPLSELAKFIKNISNIDERLEKGDPELVNEIAKNIGAVNIYSFASKYCTYHNVEVYCNDDYSIIDSVVKKTLPVYAKDVNQSQIGKWLEAFDYKSFNDCIGSLLDENNIHNKFRRRKFDHFLWYANRNK